MNDIIKGIVEELQVDFNEHPYDYTSYEIEAQVRIFDALRQRLTGSIKINRSDAFPSIEDQQACRIKLETGFNGQYHDIVVFKDGSTAKSKDDVEAVIEIKIGWGYTEAHMTHPGVVKDCEVLQDYGDRGYFLFFLANRFDAMQSDHQFFYKNEHANLCKRHGIQPGHFFLIFRDQYFA